MMLPDNLREFDDMATTRKWLYEDTAKALQSRFPYEDDEWRLELADVKVQEKDYDLRKQKDAIISDRRMPVPVKGTWRLIHKPDNKVVDQHSGTVMNLPYITDRGTYVYNGNEYSMLSQSRLKPGAYTRIRRSGEPETMFNVRPRTGRTFRMIMEPKTGIYKFDMGGSSIPAMPLLQAMGVDDKQIMDALGPDLTAVNMKAGSGSQVLSRLYNRVAGRQAQKGLSSTQQAQQIRELLEKAELEPDVIRRTLGLEENHITGPVLLRAMQKMRNIQRGEERPDDRDAPKFSNVLSVEDLLPERISKDAGNLSRQLFWAAKRAKGLKKFQHAPLNPYVDEWMLKSRLTMPLEETNPLSLLEQMNRITKLGEGGIGSAEAITDEARDVNPGQTGFVDLVAGPEGLNIGIDVRTAFKTYKGRDRQMYAEFRNPKTGKIEYHKPEELDSLKLAFPGDLRRGGDTIQVLHDGELEDVPRDEVDLEIPSLGHMNHAFANLNPMPTAFQSARAFYAGKFWGQYLPQAKGEIPLVDSVMADSDQTYSEYYGRRLGSLKSPVSGTVKKIDGDTMHIQDKEGKTHKVDMVKAFPFNRLTGISFFPMVEEGATVKEGEPVAHSNFTDKSTGSLTLGQNLRTAVVPFRGYSYEDAQILSESAAKKLSTERLYGYDTSTKNGVTLGKNQFRSLFPKRFTKDQLENIDDNGVVKPGTRLRSGDPITLATGPKLLSAEDMHLGRLHKTLRNARTDKSEIWDHDYEGVVTDVKSTRNGAKVFVAAAVPVQVGDKLSGRHGLKGTVGRIVPDEQMPRDPATNEPYEFLLNPMGIQSRVAPAALLEMQLARIARKTGKQMRIPQEPPEEGWGQWVKNLMDEHGLSAREDVFDPELGRTLDEPVQVGEYYMMAFHHLSDKKESARGSAGLAYSSEDQPAKGQGDARSAKRLSTMDLNALLAHGAADVINDAIMIRGSRNDEYFRALRQGLTLPTPKVPMIYDKMLDTLKAAGINIEQKKNLLELMPMTDDDVSKLSAGPVQNSKLVDRNLEPVKGGLFDVGLTGGGLVGNRWSHIELPEPMPNPIFEEPIRRMLGLKQKELEDVINHKHEINGETGGVALKNALSNLDIDKEIKRHRELVKTSRGAARDNSIKVLGYLDTLRRQGKNPGDWVISKVPVLPPKFRPLSQMGDVMISADMNELYQNLIESGESVRALAGVVDDEELAEDRAMNYAALRAVTGMGEAITPEGRARRLKGALKQIIGDSPKTGLFQSRVLSKPVDLVGRGVVGPDPNLDMDTIGIPEDSAWTLYKDFVLRRLRRQNIPMTRALEMYEERHPSARREMLKEMETRPVIVDRAPTWHKFNFMAFKPVPIEGSTVRAPPLIHKSFTLDHDGDQMNFHVVVDDKAAEQAWERMRPSVNLLSLTDLRSPRYGLEQEFALGIYRLTKDPDPRERPVVFRTREEAEEAYRNKQIRLNTPIIIRGEQGAA